MGKKVKVGKARKDKFYHLAKDTGYRSRASFKLLQLNRNFGFLQRSSICIDLCAAPGGWLQVALEHMPTSCLLVGVDLAPIKPIHGVTTIQEDITTDKCRQKLKKILLDSKADLVLHDGAPNVGKNWLHDAFQQAELTLQALKLATDFLVKGGTFVTKVFRSKDYFSLMWVFKQMFKTVHATKPLASRNESAEIFVVCQKYLAPDVIDPKFLDPRHVFKDAELPAKPLLNLFHPEKVSKKVEGYEEGNYTLTNKLSALTFATESNYLELLQRCTEIEIDDDEILEHPATTNEIKECCKDIRVLGEKSIKDLRKWRTKIHNFLQSRKQENQTRDVEMEVDGDDSDKDSLDEEFEKQQEAIDDREREKLKEKKKKRKQIMKEKRKMRDKQELGMERPDDVITAQDDVDLFSLDAVKREAMSVFTRDDADMDEENVDDGSDHEMQEAPKKKIKFDRDDIADYDDEGKNWDTIRNKEREDIGDDDEEEEDDIMQSNEKPKKKKKVVKLTPAELAIGEELIKSRKRKREIIDMSYNRYSYDDDNAPDWFLHDDQKHSQRQLPVTKEQIQRYKEKQRAIDANPIKKVAEAMAKKKFKLNRKLEKARKKTEGLSEEFSEKEKMKQAKEIYKKAGLLKSKKKEVTYVVAKKGVGKRVARPAGVKGHYKVVDPRMKKDIRMNKNKASKGKGGGKKGKGGGKKGKGGKTGKGKKRAGRH